MTHNVRNDPILERVDALIDGFITKSRAEDIVRSYPDVVQSIASWIDAAAWECNWRRVERLANLGAHLNPPDFARSISDLIEMKVDGLNYEDLVEILGDVGASGSAEAVFRLIRRSLQTDAPAYWLSQKGIITLEIFETSEADHYLREMTSEHWPAPIRWHAAVSLGIEEDLGFDEDEMCGY